MEPKLWSEQPHYFLRQDKTTIGRGSSCDIRIGNPTVSRVHLELEWRAETLILTHLSPVNPTFVNGAPVAEPRPLRNGDIIEIADGVALRVELSGGGDKDATQFRGRDARRMYAILSADVVGYARLVEQDDIATARQLENSLKIVRDRVEQMDGRIFQIIGDGVVALFNSAGSAVKSAVVWQSDIARLNAALPPARRMEFRVGDQFWRLTCHSRRGRGRRRHQHRRSCSDHRAAGRHFHNRRRTRSASRPNRPQIRVCPNHRDEESVA